MEQAVIRGTDLLVIDEIGPFELNDKIWAAAISGLCKNPCCYMLWVVRRTLVDQVKGKWNLQNAVIIDTDRVQVDQAEGMILADLNKA